MKAFPPFGKPKSYRFRGAFWNSTHSTREVDQKQDFFTCGKKYRYHEADIINEYAHTEAGNSAITEAGNSALTEAGNSALTEAGNSALMAFALAYSTLLGILLLQG